MRILYGVSGEGSGHSSRAQVVLRHLVRQGHTVRVATYDRGVRNLSGEFDVLEIEGLHISTSDNRVDVVRTFSENLSRLSDGVRKLRELRQLFDDFEPEVCITDFEPMTAYVARHRELPLVSIDNQHRMRYMSYPCPAELERDAKVTETIIRLMVPSPDAALVTTFYQGPTKNSRTFLCPPLIRQEVQRLGDAAAAPDPEAPILVYFTQGFETFLELLGEFPRERFLVYGADAEQTAAENITYFEPSRDGFLRHLSEARGVIATAGFTLLTESLFLRKPYLALPMRGQFEQELNAHLLAEAGYGARYSGDGSEEIAAFLYRIPEYRERLEAYDPGSNEVLFEQLDRLLAEDAAELRRLKAGR
ncbi:hypothetical protein ABI59_13740 [Acidobacteria bacterium Mor1]|nr:hypothetical protein ABI59_13740 [Acidobacteria bacterium Mor1]